jgi:hypothetical protein
MKTDDFTKSKLEAIGSNTKTVAQKNYLFNEDGTDENDTDTSLTAAQQLRNKLKETFHFKAR